MRRLAFISTMDGYAWGGSEELWSRAASKIAKETSVCCSVGARMAGHPRLHQLSNLRVSVYPRLDRQESRLAQWTRLLRLRREPPNPWLGFLQKTQPNLVIVSQGSSIDGARVACFLAEEGIPYCLVSQCHGELWWPDDALLPLVRRAYSKAVRSFFVSRKNQQLLEQQLDMKIPRSELVWNPGHPAQGEELAWPSRSKDGRLRLACVGRLDPATKGQDILLLAWARSDEAKEFGSLSFFGSGPYREALRSMASSLGLANVEFLGHAPDPASVWRDHHALVLPSRAEGMPLVMIEAMRSGRPTLTTGAGCMAELCQQGQTGIVVEHMDSEAFAAGLASFFQMKECWQNMGQVAAQRLRSLMPSDPVEDFCQRLRAVAAEVGISW